VKDCNNKEGQKKRKGGRGYTGKGITEEKKKGRVRKTSSKRK